MKLYDNIHIIMNIMYRKQQQIKSLEEAKAQTEARTRLLMDEATSQSNNSKLNEQQLLQELNDIIIIIIIIFIINQKERIKHLEDLSIEVFYF